MKRTPHEKLETEIEKRYKKRDKKKKMKMKVSGKSVFALNKLGKK